MKKQNIAIMITIIGLFNLVTHTIQAAEPPRDEQYIHRVVRMINHLLDYTPEPITVSEQKLVDMVKRKDPKLPLYAKIYIHGDDEAMQSFLSIKGTLPEEAIYDKQFSLQRVVEKEKPLKVSHLQNLVLLITDLRARLQSIPEDHRLYHLTLTLLDEESVNINARDLADYLFDISLKIQSMI